MSLPRVRLVTYAWGQRYVDRLLDFTLSSVLAPGNLPALAHAVDCTVVVVTEEGLFDHVRAHPIARQVGAVCPLRLVALDDLVAEPWQYGLTVAYALFRGFAELGGAMTDTYVLFLNADFVVADGSYARLLPHIQAGERVLLSPSYCVVEERVRPLLAARRDATTGVLAFPPRELAQVIIDYRHNTIRAKTANQRLVHFEYMDQFYWLVDEHTLLAHQMPISLIAMRPERALTNLATFWDWGTVYDFCPSQRLTALGDSDEFLMMEMRPAETYFDSIRLGWRPPRTAAAKLATYITRYQLDNVRFPLTVHSRELPAGVEAARASLRAYAEKIVSLLPSAPPDHRDHASWAHHKRHFEQYRATRGMRSERVRVSAEIARLEGEYRAAVDSVTQRYEPKLQALRDTLEGLTQESQPMGQPASTADPPQPAPSTGARPRGGGAVPTLAVPRALSWIDDAFPYVGPWHPLHLPYRRVSAAVNHARGRGAPPVLAVCAPQSALAHAVAAWPGPHARLSVSDLRGGHLAGIMPGSPRFDLCVIELSITALAQGPELYRAIMPHMERDGTVLIHGSNSELAPRESWEPAVIRCLIDQPQGVEVHYSGSSAGWRAVKLLGLANRIRRTRRRGSRYYRIPLLAGVSAAMASLALTARIQEGHARRPAASVPSRCTGITIEITAGARH